MREPKLRVVMATPPAGAQHGAGEPVRVGGAEGCQATCESEQAHQPPARRPCTVSTDAQLPYPAKPTSLHTLKPLLTRSQQQAEGPGRALGQLASRNRQERLVHRVNLHVVNLQCKSRNCSYSRVQTARTKRQSPGRRSCAEAAKAMRMQRGWQLGGSTACKAVQLSAKQCN